MKIYVTGTTSGLGQAIKDEIKKTYIYPTIIDLNKPDYDLSLNLDNYIKDDFDVYINNAHYSFAQTELLYKLVEVNKNRECHIINIGSVSSDGDRKIVNHYAIEKTALEKACTQLSLINSKCKISLVKPGRMNTKMVKHIDAPKLDTKEVARVILWMINQPRHINIKSISVDIMQELK